MIVRAVLAAALLLMAPAAAQASIFDELQQEIFDEEGVLFKSEYRKCNGDSQCAAVLSLCRWRPVNLNSKKYVEDLSKQVKLECKWPPPLPNPPVARCVKGLCTVPPDGKNY